MMNPTLKIVLTSIGTTIVCAYVASAIVFLPDYKQELVCRQLDITIADSTKRQFISSYDIRRQLHEQGLLPENKPYDEIQTQAVEDAVALMEVVSNVECCKMNSGNISLNIRQREPVLRVIGVENYYIDTNRRVMKASYKTACHVPVITGFVTRDMAQNELFDFACWLDDHTFWNAQIEQINVLSNREIELVPRVGGHIILLGSLHDYESKLNKLKIFYDDGLSKMGWEPWKEVDLRFKGQIVCR